MDWTPREGGTHYVIGFKQGADRYVVTASNLPTKHKEWGVLCRYASHRDFSFRFSHSLCFVAGLKSFK